MGDRVCVVVRDDYACNVCLYSHWGGSTIRDVLKAALIRGSDRHGDTPYLARIIFCEMVGDDLRGTTGFGIQSRPSDDAALVVVDTHRQTVSFEDERPISFAEFTRVADPDPAKETGPEVEPEVDIADAAVATPDGHLYVASDAESTAIAQAISARFKPAWGMAMAEIERGGTLEDLHSYMAAEIFQIPYEHFSLRDNAVIASDAGYRAKLQYLRMQVKRHALLAMVAKFELE